MTDRVMAIFTLLVLGVFLGVLAVEVPRLDLGVLLGITYALTLYDFLLSPSRVGRK